MKNKRGLAPLASQSLDEGWSEQSESNGFTLIELLVVIIIIGILAAVITGNFFTSLKKGRDARRKEDLGQIQRALEMYYEDKKAYPTAAASVGFPFSAKFCETSSCAGEKIYMQKVPNDPTGGQSYLYISDDGKSYQLYACLENNQQVLPYTTNNSSLSCPIMCKDKSGDSVECRWGVSSSNTNP